METIYCIPHIWVLWTLRVGEGRGLELDGRQVDVVVALHVKVVLPVLRAHGAIRQTSLSKGVV